MLNKDGNIPTLGYGTAGLGILDSEADVLSLLDSAFINGIRHFDTSNSYGYGDMEAICGKFIRNKRSELTLTSKFGLPILCRSGASANGVRFVRSLLKSCKPLYSFGKKILRKAVSQQSHLTREDFINSLEQSLIKTKLDYLDCYMIHERNLAEVNADDIFSAMLEMIGQGKIKNAGIAVSANQLPNYLKANMPQQFIIQTEGGLFWDNTNLTNNAQILQRIFSIDLNHSAKYPQLLEKYGENTLRRWQLAWALRSSNNGICLFGSLSPKHIEWNAATYQSLVDKMDDVCKELSLELNL